MKSSLFQRFYAAVAFGVAMLSIAFCPNARAGDADPQWTCGKWTTFTAAENNVFLNLTSPNFSGDARFVDGVGNGSISTVSASVGNNAKLTFNLLAPANVTELRIYNLWDTGREELNVSSVVITDKNGGVMTLPGAYCKSYTSRTYGFLARPDGLPICYDVTQVVFNFGSQQNGWVGCSEIEALAAPYDALCDVVQVDSTLPGVGAPSPAYGATRLAADEHVTMRLETPVIDVNEGFRYVCTGWRLYRHDSATGGLVFAAKNGETDRFEADYVHGEAFSKFEWQWEKQYKVTVTAGEGGTVTPAESVWVSANQAIDVLATPSEGRRFRRWTGDVPAARQLDPSFTLKVTDAPCALQAVFDSAEAGVTEVETPEALVAALGTASAGDVILLKKTEENGGVYSLGATLELGSAVTVRGATGDPADIILDAGANKRALTITAAALVEGLTVRNGKLSGTSKGAGVYMTTGLLRNCRVTENVLSGSQGCGGGVCVDGADAVVENCEITANKGDLQTYGSGIYNNGGTVRGCVIHGNKSSRTITWGIGLYQKGATAVTEGCVVSNHVQTGLWGGPDARFIGAWVEGGLVHSTVFTGNHLKNVDAAATDTGAAAVAVRLGNATLANCTIAGNTSSSKKDCAGVSVSSGNAVIENCLFADNYNTCLEAADDVRAGTLGTWTCNALANPTLVTGVGNIVTPARPFGENGWELPHRSPCIGAGRPELWMAAAEDLVGNDRLRYVDGEKTVDIGACAYVPQPITILIQNDADSLVFDTMNINFTSEVEGEIDGITYYWDIDGDGAADRVGQDLASITMQETRFGDYSTRLYVTNAVGVGGYSEAIKFKFRPSTVHIVPGASAPVWPHASAETAAATLEAAALRDNLQKGMTVVYHRAPNAEGATVYSFADTLVIDKPVTVRGETGDPKDIIFDGDSARRVVRLTNADATLSSVTVRNGKLTSSNSYGAGIYVDAGTVTNCLVTGCVLSGNQTRGSGVHLASRDAVLTDSEITKCKGGLVAYGVGVNNEGGKVIRCLIHGNLVGDNIYSGIGLQQSGSTALADSCIVTNNTYNGGRVSNPRVAGVRLNGGEMRNSLIANNGIGSSNADDTQPAAGGVYVDAARLVNCTVVDNFSANERDCAGVTVTASATIENCYVVRNLNKVTKAEDDVRTAAKGTWLSTVVKGATGIATGSGNREPDDVPFKDGSYDLADGAVCIGIGVVETWMEDATDLAGRARLRADARGESIVDAGCYAYVEPDLATPIYSDDERLQLNGFSATIRCEPLGDTEGLVYYWDTDGDGTADRIGSDLRQITVATDVFGIIPVKLYATNAVSGASAESATITFTHVSRTVYVDDDSATPAWPYGTPATAAAKFTDAVEVANLGDGFTVKVAPGNYPVTKESWFKTRVTVEGTGASRDDAAIVGNKSFRIIRLQASGSILRNLTISKGKPSGSDENAGGGGIRVESGAVVENCKVTDCAGGRPTFGPGICCIGGTVRDCHVTGTTVGGSSSEGGAAIVYGAGIYVNGAAALVERCIVEDCKVTGCHCRNGHDQGTGIEIQGGVVRASLIRNCTLLRADAISGFNDDAIRAAGVHLKGGKLVNCTVLNCSANYGGTGGVCAKGGTVENCLIWGNTRYETAGGEQVASNWDAKYDSKYTYCCTTPALADEHSTTADPKFKHPGLFDALLSGTSPCKAGSGLTDISVHPAGVLDLYGAKLLSASGKAPIGCVSTAQGGTMVILQ